MLSDEETRPKPNNGNTLRHDLYHVSLPGVEHDPLWVEYMEAAAATAVDIMEGNFQDPKQLILGDENNTKVLIRRLKKEGIESQDGLLEGVGEKVIFLVEYGPTLRDISDYVIATAHYNYKMTKPEYQERVSDTGIISQTVCPYGVPRELDPVFGTSFRGQYQINPYQDYVERVLAQKEQNGGQMTAKLSKLHRSSHDGRLEVDESGEELNLTRTHDSEWQHTDISLAPKIWDHIEALYLDLKNLQNTDGDLDVKLDVISQIGWWYFQLMPYTRGSSAIGITLLQSLFDFAKIDRPPYKVGISPDLEVFVTSLPKFVDNFKNLFDGEVGVIE